MPIEQRILASNHTALTTEPRTIASSTRIRILLLFILLILPQSVSAAIIDAGGSDDGGNTVTDFSTPGLLSFAVTFGEHETDLDKVLLKVDLEPGDTPNLAFNMALENQFPWDWSAVQLTIFGGPTIETRGDIQTAGEGDYLREYFLEGNTKHIAQFNPWEAMVVLRAVRSRNTTCGS